MHGDRKGPPPIIFENMMRPFDVIEKKVLLLQHFHDHGKPYRTGHTEKYSILLYVKQKYC
jgi:hypothetical protein